MDGIVIVDDQARIRLASPAIVHDFRPKRNRKSLADTDYYRTMFGLDRQRRLDEHKIAQIPLHTALNTGKSVDEPPYHILPARNGIAYQVETRVATFPVNGRQTRVALEFWRRMGDPQVFEKHAAFIKL